MTVRTMLKFLGGLLLALVAVAQQDRGTLVGTVTDPTGAAMPGVAISATHIQTNQKYSSVSNDVGQYRIPNLPVGAYRVTFEMSGFKLLSVKASV